MLSQPPTVRVEPLRRGRIFEMRGAVSDNMDFGHRFLLKCVERFAYMFHEVTCDKLFCTQNVIVMRLPAFYNFNFLRGIPLAEGPGQ